MQRETQMVEQINNMRNIRITLNQNQRSTEDQLIDFSQQLKLSNHQYDLNNALLKKDAISQEEFYQINTEKSYLEQKVNVLKERIKTDSDYRKKQIERIDHSITLMNRNLSIIRNKLKELTITAPISGQLNYFDYEVGQMITANQNIGRIDKTERYVLRTQIDQHYIGRITEGIQAKIRINNASHTLQIYKIFPRIENGQFTVLLEFIDTPPESLRRGQSFQVQIELSAQRKSILIPKGGHYQSSGGQYVYVLSADGSQARKRNVKFGNKNPKYYEIKSGLEVGEKIITSNYEQFKTNNLLTILQ
jgi:HlyD family secretion protein